MNVKVSYLFTLFQRYWHERFEALIDDLGLEFLGADVCRLFTFLPNSEKSLQYVLGYGVYLLIN